jgi:hypothetical protein
MFLGWEEHRSNGRINFALGDQGEMMLAKAATDEN